MIRFAVCDDELFMRQALSEQISGYMRETGVPHSVRCFPDGGALLESGNDFDIYFLDIQMKQPDGMETARRLRQKGNRGLLIFVTVLRDPVFDAFSVEAFDYLVKPLEPDRFRRTMGRALQTMRQQKEKSLVIRRGNSCEILSFSQIAYCEVQGRKVYIHQSDGRTVDYYEKLDALARRVDGRFFRCHRSYLVNLQYVHGCGAGRVFLPQGESIPVSRLRERELAEALLRCMKERDA